jgi:formylmethanofuran dehydrogenase subunit C
MKNGEITIYGDAGMHLGEGMKSGKIVVYGNVGSWAGSMMKGGAIEIHGDAGDYLGAPYRGSSEGMREGKISVYGNVGNEAGANMRTGIIKIYGCAGQFVGFRMHDGTIYVQKDAEARAGACMIGGKIVIGGSLESVLPTFTIESIKEKVKIEEGETVEGPFYLFLGDLAERGHGKLYVFKEKNPHLSCYERLL